MIMVTAATGEFGRLVVDQLLERVPASDVAVAVRDMPKAADLADRGVQVRHGDYRAARQRCATAFDGADRLLFISAPNENGDRVRQHQNVVDAARVAGVGRLVYTSGSEPMSSSEGGLADHHATERAIRDERSAVHDLAAADLLGVVHPSGPAGGDQTPAAHSEQRRRGMKTALRADLAEAAAIVLTSQDQLDEGYDFTGRRWTFHELARGALRDLRPTDHVSGGRRRRRHHDDDRPAPSGRAPSNQTARPRARPRRPQHQPRTAVAAALAVVSRVVCPRDGRRRSLPGARTPASARAGDS